MQSTSILQSSARNRAGTVLAVMALCALTGGLAACGQKGSLYLPVAATASAAPVAIPASAAASEAIR